MPAEIEPTTRPARSARSERPLWLEIEESFEVGVPGHQYSVGVVQLVLETIFTCCTGQRAAAAVLELFCHWLPGVDETPCPNTARLWSLRVGLYELTRAKEQAEDWVWIMDHTIQLGPYKCLVIVGVRLSVWNTDRRPLRYDDLVLLNLTPMEQATGERVHQALVETIAVTGLPRQVVSDGGTDLKRGMELLHVDHPQVAHVHDIKHKMALLLKKELEHNERWKSFVARTNQTKIGIVQTALASLAPPALKTKARYMNLDTLVEWGRDLLRYIDSAPNNPQLPVDLAKLEEKCGWIREYRDALHEWSELLSVAGVTEQYVRTQGYHTAAPSQLEVQLDSLATTATAQRMSDAVLEIVREESAAANSPDERLLGSSEVLESLIGKYKQHQATHNKGGMTGMLLTFGTIISNKTQETIIKALETVKTSHVGQWCRKHLGVTLQAQRQKAFPRKKTRGQNTPEKRLQI